MEKLTSKQETILKELKKYIAKYSYPPSVRDLCKITNLKSTATIQVHLEALAEKGYIKKSKDKKRAIILMVENEYANDNKTVSIPLLGMVTAGSPIMAISQPDNFFDVPSHIISSNKDVFALKVKGSSMIKSGILDGDIIIASKNENPNNKEIVVAMIDDSEVTVKTYYKEKDHIRLQPENDDYEPIIREDVTILGIVIGLYRIY